MGLTHRASRVVFVQQLSWKWAYLVGHRRLKLP